MHLRDAPKMPDHPLFTDSREAYRTNFSVFSRDPYQREVSERLEKAVQAREIREEIIDTQSTLSQRYRDP